MVLNHVYVAAAAIAIVVMHLL